ncbi:hypothetical protein CRUP_012394, partial [Coryphaenoides rupestris]
GLNVSAVTREFTYLLVKSGSVVLRAESELKGYTPGQVIKLKVNVHNQSGKTTSMVVASLMQKVSYETKKPTYDLRTNSGGGGPPSSLAGCDLIKIDYYIKPAPKPAPRKPSLLLHPPTAPPAEGGRGAVGGGDAFPTKSHVQMADLGPRTLCRPRRLATAPGLTFPQNHRHSCGALNPSGPLFSEVNANPMPTGSPLICPRTISWPQAPPSYNESFNT